MFGRRKREVGSQAEGDFVDDLDAEDRALEDAEILAELEREEAEEAGLPRRVERTQRPRGPWDVADAPDREDGRLDLGSLKVAVLPDIDVRLEVSPEGDVVAATLVHGDSALQVNAFAAPRSEGIWAEVRAEILEALTGGGGSGQEVPGPLGTELRAKVPTEVPGQGVVLAPARFVGVDGPRWFLRGLLTGSAATDDAAAEPLLAALREVAVDRGPDPMAVREPLPITLPPDAAQAVGEALEQEQEQEQQSLQMPQRGPEITETR